MGARDGPALRAVVAARGRVRRRRGEELEEAAHEYVSLGLRFEAARSLLALGRAQRRHGSGGRRATRWSAAVAAFDRAGLDGLGGGWPATSSRASARAARPSRRADAGRARVAELAAQGLANKEIAQALVVTVSTVEFHLSKTYAKLGIRSRAQLASRFASGAPSKASRTAVPSRRLGFG